MDISLFINSIYIISALLFIAGLKMMTSPSTARSGTVSYTHLTLPTNREV